MNGVAPCPRCGCTTPSQAHVLQAALQQDDLDRAMDAGLVDAIPCPGCTAGCTGQLIAARDARRAALAARERHRARDARLARLKAARDAKRAAASALPSALPPAAAAALARARAKASKP